jgi:pantetheine-phosphate adenylyltransferase
MTSLAVYAGSFDPLTLGHLDLVERGAELFDRLVLAVGRTAHKSPLFSVEERVAMAARIVKKFPNVEVDSFDCLLVDYARRRGARILIRGLRAYSDFEYEFPMALTNRKLAPDIETLFMMPKEIHSFISSSIVRELARLGGDTRQFVPAPVHRAILAKVGRKEAGIDL